MSNKTRQQLDDGIDRHRAAEKAIKAYGTRVGKNLAKKCPSPNRPDDFDSILAADGLAAIMNQLVHRSWDPGDGLLTIEWAVTRLLTLRFEDYIPRLLQIYDRLVERDIVSKEKEMDWNDLDNSTYVISTHSSKDESLKVFVSTTQCTNYLFIIRQSRWNTDVHVRQFWAKTKRCVWDGDAQHTLAWFIKKRFNVEYGDFRDTGYVLSYNCYHINYADVNCRHAKIEQSHNHWPQISYCMLNIDFLYQQLFSPE